MDEDHAKIPSEPEITDDVMSKEKGKGPEDAKMNVDSCFKVPADIAFKRPLFNKVPKKSSEPLSTPPAPHDDKKPAPEQEENTTESTSSQKSSAKSPAQQIVEKSVPLPYKEPTWSGLPKYNYSFEILKTGTIVGTIPLDKPFLVIGRLPQCDIVLEHPSLSRFHCIIQYRAKTSDNEEEEEGFYAYDLGSTHGSFHNRHQMKPHTYYRLRVGHVIKFGGSSRMFIMQGPDEDQEPESDLTVTELKAEAAKRAEKLRRLETGEVEEEDRDRRISEGTERESNSKQEGEDVESQGIDWGMGEDAQEEEDDEDGGGENPFASLNEELYLNDPKKTLRGWFEREGYDLPEYVAEDVSPGVYRCKVELPIPGPGGGPLVAIAEHKGKKKAAVIQCALEACRLLDKQGLLRQAKHESHEKKRKDWAKDDYYDSDEDDFWDRTGDVQRKRLKRMKTFKGSSNQTETETYDSLMSKYNEVIDELTSLEKKLMEAERMKQTEDARSRGGKHDYDDLDSFMNHLKSQVPDKHKRVNWKLRTIDLRKEELRLRRLVNVARPPEKSELMPYISKLESKQNLMVSKSSQKPWQHSFHPSMQLKANQHRKEGVFTSPLVRRAFQEEEPEKKLKLRRLDDDDDDALVPIPYKSNPSKKGMVKKIREPTSGTPLPSNTVSMVEHGQSSTTDVDPDRRSQGNKSEDSRHVTEEANESSCSTLPVLDVDKDMGNPKSQASNNELDIRLPSGDTNLPNINTDDAQGESVYKKDESAEKGKNCGIIKGPTLPSRYNLQEILDQQNKYTQEKKKKSKKTSSGGHYDTACVSQYETWLPPANQTGDGRTSLNEKYGY